MTSHRLQAEYDRLYPMRAAPVLNAPYVPPPCDVEPWNGKGRELPPPHKPIKRGRQVTGLGFAILCFAVVAAVAIGTYLYG